MFCLRLREVLQLPKDFGGAWTDAHGRKTIQLVRAVANFPSKICSRTFAQMSSLYKHRRVHDKKRPYECAFPDCGKTFSQISNLIRHKMLHSDDKPFECNLCQKRFYTSSNMEAHLKSHVKEVSTFSSMFRIHFSNVKLNLVNDLLSTSRPSKNI